MADQAATQQQQNQEPEPDKTQEPDQTQPSNTKRVQLATGEWEELPTPVADEYIKFRDLVKSINGGKIEERLAKIEQRANEKAEAKFKAQYEKKIQEAGSAEEIRKLLEEQYSAQLKKAHEENQLLKNERRNILKILYDAGYVVLIVNTEYNLVRSGKPNWGSLYQGELSKRECRLVDAMVQKFLDEEGITAPNGYHVISGNFRTLYGQDNIDRQIKDIKDSGLPCGLIWHLELRYRKDF